MSLSRLSFACSTCMLLVASAFGQQGERSWIATWTTPQQTPEPNNALPPADLTDATLRQIVHLSAGGQTLRVHLSNAFGTGPLHVTATHLARPLAANASAIDPATDRPLTFAGKADVVIPPGAEYVSDPVTLSAAPLSNLAISIHLDAPPQGETGHPGSRATTWYVHGDATAATTLDSPKSVEHWYQIAEVDVIAGSGAATVVALGDSITDGHAAGTNANERWTDVLAARLQADRQGRLVAVSNAGIGGNHLLTDGLGPNVLARFDRDVLAPAGVRWVIAFEGVNDLGALSRNPNGTAADHTALVEHILAAYQQIIVRAHARGVRVYGATITPYVGSDYYHPAAASEADRQAVNLWIRTPGHFDAVIDFDRIVRDPQHPDRLLPALDCGDHLHPSPAGYRAMGEAVPLTLFKP